MILAGDVGGTKTSLALYRREARGLLRDRMATYRSREHAGLDSILRDFLSGGAPSSGRASEWPGPSRTAVAG